MRRVLISNETPPPSPPSPPPLPQHRSFLSLPDELFSVQLIITFPYDYKILTFESQLKVINKFTFYNLYISDVFIDLYESSISSRGLFSTIWNKSFIKLIIENLLLIEIFSFSVLIVRYFEARRRGEIVRTVRTKSKPINFLDEMDIKQSSGLLLHIINFRRKTIRVLYLFDKLCHVSDHSGQSSVH